MPENATRPSRDVVHTSLKGGDGVLLHIGKRKYYSLNVTAARIWQLVSEGRSEAEIAAQLMQEYEVSHEQAAASVRRLVEELIAGEFLEVKQAGS